MRNRFWLSRGIIILALIVVMLPVTSVMAHGSTQVGDYQVEIGFKNEPALQNLPNGLELLVTNSKTNQPVTGLENTLQAEVIFGASKKSLKIEPVEGEDGAYTAFLLPTEVGDYTWHIFGKIENTPADITMTSSPTTFASVVPQADESFPGKASTAADLQAQVQSVQQMALAGVIVGVLGILIGIAALVFARRKV